MQFRPRDSLTTPFYSLSEGGGPWLRFATLQLLFRCAKIASDGKYSAKTRLSFKTKWRGRQFHWSIPMKGKACYRAAHLLRPRKHGVYYKTRSLFESLHICDVPYTKYCSKTMGFITKYCQVEHSAHSALCTPNLTYYSKWSTSCKQCYFWWIHGEKIIKILYKCCRNHRLLF